MTLTFDRDTMSAVATRVCTQLGLEDDQELLHLSNNAIIALPSNKLVVRILRSHTLTDRPFKTVRLGRWFNDIEAPTIALWDTIDQPLTIDGHLVTIWEYLPPQDPEPDATDLGSTLREWHQLTPPADIVSQWDPITPARQRIADAPQLPTTDKQYLSDWCDHLEPHVKRIVQQNPTALIHGDAHPGNLLRDKGGQVRLCDFDSTATGPFQVDLAAIAAASTWFHTYDTHRQLATAYGYDVTTDPEWAIFKETRELTFVLGGVPHLNNPSVAAEFRHRLTSIQSGISTVPWTPYSQLTR